MTKAMGIRRAAVTGATGFIGSHLTRRLVEKGLEVAVIKREGSDTWRIKDLLKKVSLYDGSLEDGGKISRALSSFRPDAVFHLASYYAVEHKAEEVSPIVNSNVLGTINLLEASVKNNIKFFINTSSCFVYAKNSRRLKETAPLKPVNLYALTKIDSEGACSFYAERYGLKCATFRLFSPYGPADNGRKVIPYLIMSFLDGKRPRMTSGRQRWDFIYIDDMIDAYVSLLDKMPFRTGHEIFNIGSGETHSIKEIGSRLRGIIGAGFTPEWGAIPHKKNEIWHICADISKARRLLGWSPKTKLLDKGLALTADWYAKFFHGGS